MRSVAEVESIMQRAWDEVYQRVGVYPTGFGVTSVNGEWGLAVNLPSPPKRATPSTILGIPAVYRIGAAPQFLSSRRETSKAGP